MTVRLGRTMGGTIQQALAGPLESRVRKMSAMTENNTIGWAKKRYATKMGNPDCSYCFVPFKEELYLGSEFRMRDDLLTTYLCQQLE